MCRDSRRAWWKVPQVEGLVLLAHVPVLGLTGRLLASQLTQRGVWSMRVGMPLRCAATRHRVEQ